MSWGNDGSSVRQILWATPNIVCFLFVLFEILMPQDSNTSCVTEKDIMFIIERPASALACSTGNNFLCSMRKDLRFQAQVN